MAQISAPALFSQDGASDCVIRLESLEEKFFNLKIFGFCLIFFNIFNILAINLSIFCYLDTR